MLVIGLSGSPRVGGNTDIILQEALAAAKAEGAEVKLIRFLSIEFNPVMVVWLALAQRNALQTMTAKTFTRR